jgi:hypothetical protein
MLLEEYGVDARDLDDLIAITGRRTGRGWWDEYAYVLPADTRDYLALEAVASRLLVQAVLDQGRLEITAVLGEAALRQQVGDAATGTTSSCSATTPPTACSNCSPARNCPSKYNPRGRDGIMVSSPLFHNGLVAALGGSASLRGQAALRPPSTSRMAPCTKLASSPAR